MRIKTRILAVLWGLTLLAGHALAQTVEVGIREYKYEPAELKIRAGTTVKWINNEKRTSHSMLFTGPGGFESERIFPGRVLAARLSTSPACIPTPAGRIRR